MRSIIIFFSILSIHCSSTPNTNEGDAQPQSDATPASDAQPDTMQQIDAATDAATDAGSDTQSGGIPAGEIDGEITRTQGLTFSGDGKGTLWVDIGGMCPYSSGIDVKNTIMVPNVDLTSPNAKVPFKMTGVAPGTYQVWGWLDDNADGNPFPMGGDPGNFPTCVQATLTQNAGASVSLVFNSSTFN